MKQPDSNLCKLGVVIGLHGLRGEFKVRTHPADRDALLGVAEIHLVSPSGETVAYQLLGCRPSKGNLLLRVAGVEHVDQAESLIGNDLLVDPELIGRKPGEHFWFELEGAAVVDRERGNIGTLVGMFTTAAHGIYVIEGRFGEVMVPAVRPFLLGFDAVARVLNVDVPEGLYPESP